MADNISSDEPNIFNSLYYSLLWLGTSIADTILSSSNKQEHSKKFLQTKFGILLKEPWLVSCLWCLNCHTQAQLTILDNLIHHLRWSAGATSGIKIILEPACPPATWPSSTAIILYNEGGGIWLRYPNKTWLLILVDFKNIFRFQPYYAGLHI